MMHTSPNLVFSGHMLDADERPNERFPRRLVAPARKAIEAKLDQLGAQVGARAFCQGACGGDLLFASAVLRRGMQLQLVMPFAQNIFIARSVAYAGADWVTLFQHVSHDRQTSLSILSGDPQQKDAYSQANQHMLDSATMQGQGQGQPIVVALWDGQRNSPPGGTAHMIDMAKARGCKLAVIDLHQLLAAYPTE